MARFTIGSGHLTKMHTDGVEDDDDSDESSVGIRTATDAMETISLTAHENAFLPSVGIVMASNEVASSAHQLVAENQHDAAANASKRCSADVCTMSLSSVMDNINMPAGMLECGSPTMRSRSPAPEIRVDDVAETSGAAGGGTLGKSGAQSYSRSTGEVRLDAPGSAGQ